MGKYLNTILLFLIATSNAYAGPSVKETIDFINSVINDPQKSEASADGNNWNSIGYDKPYISHSGKCDVYIKQVHTRGSRTDFKARESFNLKLENYKMNYNFVRDTGNLGYGYIRIEDRRGISSINVNKKVWDVHDNARNSSENNKSSYSVYIKFNGVYKEKINKALKHLSDTCYQQYGNKQKELF